MRFVTFDEAASHIQGKSVAVVGSAPSCLDNKPGFVDGHDVVCRINNFKLGPPQGFRVDVHYAFYGSSVTNKVEDLKQRGVKLCWSKCPNSKPIESEWHERNGKTNGIDFRYIYHARRNWWFTDTFIPSDEMFMRKFHLLGKHIPTTGFSAILDVLSCGPREVFVTGFDFFASGIHNVDEKWKAGDPDDPIGHRPKYEARWLATFEREYPLTFDRQLERIIRSMEVAPERVA